MCVHKIRLMYKIHYLPSVFYRAVLSSSKQLKKGCDGIELIKLTYHILIR